VKRVLLMCLAALVLAAPAAAVNRPHATLNQIASEVAGKPVTAWCEDNYLTWDSMVAASSRNAQIGATVAGYTYLHAPVVYLSPSTCETLHLALTYGYKELGLYHSTRAMFTLVHEGVHQRGIGDEGVTDCTALPLVVPMMDKYLGLDKTEPSLTVRKVMRNVRRKIGGKWRTISVQSSVVGETQVTNPDYARIGAWATTIHKSKPAAYQGNC
jgi:hypothetical protein